MKKSILTFGALFVTAMAALTACSIDPLLPADSSVPVQASSQISSTPSSNAVSSFVPSQPSSTVSGTNSAIGSYPESDPSDGYAYGVQRLPYVWEQGGKKYDISYLRILGDRDHDYSKVNLLLKQRAFRLADTLGYQPQLDAQSGEAVPVTVTVTSDFAYRNHQFISVMIRTKYTIGDAEPVELFDTVNCYLDEGSELSPEQTEVTMQNSLFIEEGMADVFLEAVRDQGSDDLKKYLTKERILASLYQNPMFFTEKYIAVSFRVPHALGDHVELKLNYPELAPFMKMNTIWRSFL